MQQIGQVLRRKRAQLAKLTKEIELLQQAEEKLREIAPLLAEVEEDGGSLLVEVEDEVSPVDPAKAAAASAKANSASQSESEKPAALRWP